MSTVRSLTRTLMRPGPYRVLVGKCYLDQLTVSVFSPDCGRNHPLVVLGHDWLIGINHYYPLCMHLGSWGIVVAVPHSELGLCPSVLTMSTDLNRALDIVLTAQLGSGKVSIHPNRIGMVGHGFGGTAAIFAAVTRVSSPTALGIMFPKTTVPSVDAVASQLACPGIIFTDQSSSVSLCSNARTLACQWEQAKVCVVDRAVPESMAQHRWWAHWCGLPRSNRRTYRRVAGLLTGYLLGKLRQEKPYHIFSDPRTKLPYTLDPHQFYHPVTTTEKLQALLSQ